MRFLKLAVISLVILFLLATALGLLLPSTVRVTRNITIQAAQPTLHLLISDVKYWKLWMEGARTNKVLFLSRKTAGTGTVATIGTQRIELTSVTPNRVEAIWKTASNRQQTTVFELAGDTSTQRTNVNWYFEQKLEWYPWQRLSALASDKLIGPHMEQSLDRLKAIAEINQP